MLFHFRIAQVGPFQQLTQETPNSGSHQPGTPQLHSTGMIANAPQQQPMVGMAGEELPPYEDDEIEMTDEQENELLREDVEMLNVGTLNPPEAVMSGNPFMGVASDDLQNSFLEALAEVRK
jgi:hypothetical protein